MPDNPPADETPKPKSSADLIREAREASAGTRGPDSGASDALIQESHTWMEDRTPIADMPQADGPTATDESDLFEDTDLVFGAPAPRPAPQWQTTSTRPKTPAPASSPLGRRSRTTWLIASAVIGVAVLTNILAVFSNEGTEADVTVVEAPATTAAGPDHETTVRSDGTMTGEDPCTGTAIEGNILAAIHYRETASTATVTVTIVATDLQGADGSRYELEVVGSGGGAPGQQTFTFDSSSMIMVRDDGRQFTDQATMTIEIIDGEPSDWSYTTVGATCEP